HLDLHSFPTRRSSDLQLSHAVPAAALEHMSGAADVDVVEISPWSPDAGQSGDVKHRLAAGAGGNDSLAIGQIGAGQLDAQRGQLDRKSTRLNSSHLGI